MTPAPSARSGRSTAAFAGIVGLALALAGPALGAERPALRGDVTATRDVLTLADLVDHVPDALGRIPVFRAPALGQSGTIQARRIAAAAEAAGLPSPETGGRVAVTITRAARTVGPAEMEAAIRKQLAKEFGADPSSTGIAFDAPAPSLALPPEVAGEVVASEIALDRRSRRLSATLWIGASAAERRAQLRVSGSVVDLVEVVTLNRALERGGTVKASDLAIERRSRDLVPPDAVYDGTPLEGRVARRALSPGSLLRTADLIRPELVGRGDVVTVVYEGGGVSLALRAKSNDAGALGDTVTLVNPTSKKVLQGVVTGPGTVAVGPTSPARLATAAPASAP